MRVRVLKELPQGQEPGTILELPDLAAQAFLTVGAVERLDDPEPVEAKALSSSAPPRRRYQRRDLEAES